MATSPVQQNQMQRCGAGALIPLDNLATAQQQTEVAQCKWLTSQVWSVLTRDMSMHVHSNQMDQSGVGATTATVR